MKVSCPICHKTTNWEENRYRPFCSERCKLVDLEGWLNARYRVPVEEEEPLDEPDDPITKERNSSNGNQ